MLTGDSQRSKKKKITIPTEFHLWVAESAKDLQLKEVPFTWEAAQELRFTHVVQKDPADRFLAATAKVFDMTLPGVCWKCPT
jgi:PIN domain nuclease of toxin-antitoxin system